MLVWKGQKQDATVQTTNSLSHLQQSYAFTTCCKLWHMELNRLAQSWLLSYDLTVAVWRDLREWSVHHFLGIVPASNINRTHQCR